MRLEETESNEAIHLAKVDRRKTHQPNGAPRPGADRFLPLDDIEVLVADEGGLRVLVPEPHDRVDVDRRKAQALEDLQTTRLTLEET